MSLEGRVGPREPNRVLRAFARAARVALAAERNASGADNGEGV